MSKKVIRFVNYNSRNNPENCTRNWRMELQDIISKQVAHCDHFECKNTH